MCLLTGTPQSRALLLFDANYCDAHGAYSLGFLNAEWDGIPWRWGYSSHFLSRSILLLLWPSPPSLSIPVSFSIPVFLSISVPLSISVSPSIPVSLSILASVFLPVFVPHPLPVRAFILLSFNAWTRAVSSTMVTYTWAGSSVLYTYCHSRMMIPGNITSSLPRIVSSLKHE